MDIGWGEMLLLGLVALLIFGPDKLPRAAADAGRLIRRVREMAGQARSDLKDSAGVDVKALTDDLRSVTDLHPRKLIGSTMAGLSLGDDDPAGNPVGGGSPPAAPPALNRATPSDSSGAGGVTFDPDAT